MNYFRLGILVVVGLVIGAVVWKINDWRVDAAKVPALRDEVRQVQATLKQERKDAEDNRAISKGVQTELAKIRELAARAPTRVVRLCNDSGMPLPTSTGGTAEADAGTGALPQRAGPDIGRRLYGLVDEADAIVAQCRGILKHVDCKSGIKEACGG